MAISTFINFNGNCREAVEFYAGAFGVKTNHFMTFDQMPGGEVNPADKDKIVYTYLTVGGGALMFCDFPSEMEFHPGNNVNPMISFDGKDKVKEVFAKLSEGGKVDMELQQTFWSKLYGKVTDKFGVIWQIDYDDGSMHG